MGDFNWLKNIVKNNQKLLNILHHQKNLFFVCVCIQWMHLLYSLQKHGKKMMLKLVKNGSEMRINQKHLEKSLDIANIADRSQYYSSKFRKIRRKIQECGKY